MTGWGRGPSAGFEDRVPLKAQEHFGEGVDCVDNRRAMISLVGEQPIANLLPVLCLQPHHAVLVCTSWTRPVADKLRSILAERTTEHGVRVQCTIEEVGPYDIVDIEAKISALIGNRSWTPDEILFNLTGGTKTMAIAAYRLAESHGTPFCYLISEGKGNKIHTYRVSSDQGLEFLGEAMVGATLDIDLYLRAHLGGYEEGMPKDGFELTVYSTLQPEFDEVKASVRPHSYGNVEIDLVLRRGNSVGIVEVKSGNKAREKRGVEQIIAAGEQRFLGVYTKKILVLDREYGSDNLKLAQAHGITVIELPSAQTGALSPEDEQLLLASMRKQLGA